MRHSAESGDRPDFSRFCENPNRPAVDPTRLILGHFAPIRTHFRRLLRISATPLRNLAPSPGMRHSAGFGDRLDFSRFCENPNRSPVDPTSLVLGHFPPIANYFRRLSQISDMPHRNLALPPGMRHSADPGDRLDFSRFRENPNRPAFDPA